MKKQAHTPSRALLPAELDTTFYAISYASDDFGKTLYEVFPGIDVRYRRYLYVASEGSGHPFSVDTKTGEVVTHDLDFKWRKSRVAPSFAEFIRIVRIGEEKSGRPAAEFLEVVPSTYKLWWKQAFELENEDIN